MAKKYVHLFNFETKKEQREAKEFLSIMPSAKLEPYGIIGRKEHREKDPSWKSLWVPEEYFLIAWTYFSHRSLKNGLAEPQDAIDYFQMQINDSDFVQSV